jgi:hypothetical protein
MDRAKHTLEIKTTRYMENNSKMDIYTTLDVYIAGYLELSGFELNLKLNHAGRIAFSIPLKDEVQEALKEYRTGFVPAKAYADKIKDIKKRMYLTKDNREEGLQANGNSH